MFILVSLSSSTRWGNQILTFPKTKIADLVQIAPQDLGKNASQAIEDNINLKYANKVIQKIGLCICFYDLLSASEGLIGHGDGLVNVNGILFLGVIAVFYVLLTTWQLNFASSCSDLSNLKSWQEESAVLLRVVLEVSIYAGRPIKLRWQYQVRTHFFDEIFVPAKMLPEGSHL